MGCVVDGVHDNRGVQYEFGPVLESWPRGVDVFPQAFALGIGFRFGLHGNLDSKGLYIPEYLQGFLSYFRCALHFNLHTPPFQDRVTCNIYCVALRIYCCRLYPAQGVSGVWKAPSCVPAAYYDYVCCLRHYHISRSGACL